MSETEGNVDGDPVYELFSCDEKERLSFDPPVVSRTADTLPPKVSKFQYYGLSVHVNNRVHLVLVIFISRPHQGMLSAMSKT